MMLMAPKDEDELADMMKTALDATGPGPPVNGRVHEISGRVKQLSSAVHELSHHLHPTKLEQLGLVAAVRGLPADEFSNPVQSQIETL